MKPSTLSRDAFINHLRNIEQLSGLIEYSIQNPDKYDQNGQMELHKERRDASYEILIDFYDRTNAIERLDRLDKEIEALNFAIGATDAVDIVVIQEIIKKKESDKEQIKSTLKAMQFSL